MTQVEQIFNDQVAKNLPFVLFASPDEDQLVCLWDDSLTTSSLEPSFVFKAFDQNSKLHHIQGERRILIERENIVLQNHTFDLDLHVDKGYAQMMLEAEELLGGSLCKKIVLSRIKKVELPANFSAVKMTMALQAQYPMALTYLLFHPNCGTWIGSSPETLVKKTMDNWRTMALAGTRSLGQHTDWSQKDIDEHEYVCDHIDSQLAQMGGTSIEKGVRETIAAGPVEHLHTSYQFKYSGDLNHLVDLLHPTPAICGTPKELSYQKITELEKHDRELYCGFIGPIKTDNTHLFVNLRCMKIEEKNACLYVGGGITKDSDPILEWRETEMKAETLLKVMQNL